MATAGSGRSTCECGEEFCTSSFRPDLNEEPLNVSQEEAGQNVVEEQIDLHVELANDLKVSTISTGQAPSQDSKLINNNTTTRLPKRSMPSLPHPTTMEDLPNELLPNIFMRLLAKEIGQMRSVSKSWNALLSQSSFIKSHLNYSIHNNDQILLVFYLNKCISDYKPFTVDLSRSLNLQLTEFNKLVPVNPISGRPKAIRSVIGAVNGLICSTYGLSVIHIWNPSISAVSTLPECPMSFDNTYHISLRFGFDPKANDYKVVKVIGAFRKEWLQIGVYSMRKGSWELINQRFPSHIIQIFDSDEVCLDGHDGILHWRGYYFRDNMHTETETIVAFDLGSHTFREMPLPHSVTGCKWHEVSGVFDRKLCVMSQTRYGAREVWVMEEYGVPESWVKRHVISQFVGPTVPYGFTSYNKFLINDNGHLVLHDLIANETKAFDCVCSGNRHYAHKFVEYVDSLVWVAPNKHEMVDGSVQN